MQTQALRMSIRASLVVLGLGVAAGCGDSGSPVSPSVSERSGAGSAVPTMSSAYAVNAAFPVTPGLTAATPGPGGSLTPTDLTNRGWTCFRPPIGDRIVCSRPNQGFPAIPPPEDRPAAFTFFFFDATGVFVGTELLIRTDLYNGQRCESTGEPYVFVPFIGYYECVHAAGE